MTGIEYPIINIQRPIIKFRQDWSCHYHRTRNGAEIDLIIDGPFGTLPIEIKIGSTVKKRHLQPLKNFMAKNNIPVGILINNADSVQVVADNIVQIPATLL